MKLTQTILAIAALGITTAEAEQTFAVRKDSCFAEYHGAIYLDGPCFVITGRIDGSFSVVSVDTPDADDMNNHTGLVILNVITNEPFAAVNFGGQRHMIGNVTRDGACWGNAQGKVCTRSED